MKKICYFLVVLCMLCCFMFNVDIKTEASVNNSTELLVNLENESLLSTKSLSNEIQAPTFNHYVYNVAVLYEWNVGTGGNDLEYCYNYVDYISVNSPSFKNFRFATDYNSKNCDDLRYYQFRSVNTLTGDYSESITLESNSYEPGTVRYGLNCKYNLIGRFLEYKFQSDADLPTNFDQENCIWDHNSGFNHTIKATIAYQGYYVDFDLWIPLFGYKTTTVTLGTTEFELRTGPWKCSLRAKNSGVKAINVQFGFGVS